MWNESDKIYSLSGPSHNLEIRQWHPEDRKFKMKSRKKDQAIQMGARIAKGGTLEEMKVDFISYIPELPRQLNSSTSASFENIKRKIAEQVQCRGKKDEELEAASKKLREENERLRKALEDMERKHMKVLEEKEQLQFTLKVKKSEKSSAIDQAKMERDKAKAGDPFYDLWVKISCITLMAYILVI